MRGLILFLLAFSIVAAPMASTVAAAMGFSGEHVHYEHSWHAVSDMPAVEADELGHSSGDGGPARHCHVDHVHSTVFVIATASDVFVPDLAATRAVMPASFPVTRYPHPPFRPPQAA